MRLAISKLLSSVFKRPNRITFKGLPHGRRPRRLLGERLETRYALADDLMLPEIPLPPPDEFVDSTMSATPLTDPTIGNQTSDPTAGQLADPGTSLPLDPATTPLTDPGTTPPTDPGTTPPADPGTVQPVDPMSSNTAPVISAFSFVTDGNWITLQGLVSDDQDPTGYVVDLSGIITASLTVAPDNTFVYTFQISPDYSGTIFAQTQDFLGLTSNIASVSI